ncbi:hypothetical protein PybrP1_002053 [[Pythium] brassicae (nom. inval.)]|nr:hypothetical protein PybrP1_002053 [[Pythium] brassicae (nom. inval.)]
MALLPRESSRARASSDRSAGGWWTSAAHVGMLACIGTYAVGQVLYLSPFVQETAATVVCGWFGTSVGRDANGVLTFDGGHLEMMRPTFFVLGAVAPLLGSLVLFELARDHAPRRSASRVALAVSAFLRRKPRVLGRLSPVGYGELLFHTALLGGNVALVGYGYGYMRQYLPRPGEPFTFDTVLELLGTLLGYSCVFNMAFLFLPCTRNCAWMDFLHIPYAHGVKYHRWLGVWTLATGVGHAAPFYWLWQRQGVLWAKALPCFDCALDYNSPGFAAWFNVFGELSLAFLLVVGATSVPWVRRTLFETFYYTHHLYLLGVFFAVMHWVTIIWWLLPTLALYFVSRCVSTWNAARPVRVLAFAVLPDGILKVVLARAPGADGAFALGQFVYLNVPAVSRLQWHAFTIASAPSASPATFTVLLKALGDWTQELVALAQRSFDNGDSGDSTSDSALPVVLVDGFYGASLQSYEDFPVLCLVGGGIGATPLFAILEDMAAKLAAGGALTQRVYVVFAFRELSLLEEIHPVLAALRESDPRGEFISLHVFLTRHPQAAVLAQRVDYARFTVAAAGAQQQQTPPSETPTAAPFSPPLRSRTSRIAVYALLLSLNSLAVFWLEFGGGRLMQSGTQWWPLENFVEAATLFVFPVLVFAALAVEARWKAAARGGGASNERTHRSRAEIQSYSSIQHGAASGGDEGPAVAQRQFHSPDVVVAGDLLGEYGVAVGERPDMKRILTQVHAEFSAAQRDRAASASFLAGERIGVFISGPAALKSATEHAVAELGARCFDIHAEEFEL